MPPRSRSLSFRHWATVGMRQTPPPIRRFHCSCEAWQYRRNPRFSLQLVPISPRLHAARHHVLRSGDLPRRCDATQLPTPTLCELEPAIFGTAENPTCSLWRCKVVLAQRDESSFTQFAYECVTRGSGDGGGVKMRRTIPTAHGSL